MKDFIRLLKFIYPLCAVLFIGSVFTGAYFQDRETSGSNSFSAATWTPSATPTPTPASVVINEFMANAIGADNAAMPAGEWVELKNTGAVAQDVDGWYLYDSVNSNELQINSANVGGGSTNIAAGGYLVIYRNADGDFEMNNTTADSVRLYDGPIASGNLKDSFSYSAGTITENKTWARMPDGTGAFSAGQTPTTGATNV